MNYEFVVSSMAGVEATITDLLIQTIGFDPTTLPEAPPAGTAARLISARANRRIGQLLEQQIQLFPILEAHKMTEKAKELGKVVAQPSPVELAIDSLFAYLSEHNEQPEERSTRKHVSHVRGQITISEKRLRPTRR